MNNIKLKLQIAIQRNANEKKVNKSAYKRPDQESSSIVDYRYIPNDR